MLRRPLRVVLRRLLLLAALLWIPWAVMRAVNVEVVWPVAAAEGFGYYAIVFTLLVVIVAVLCKTRAIAVVALVGLVVLGYPRVDRVLGAEQPRAANGRTLVVATANVRFGKADTAFLARLVRSEHIDVLAVQENTIDTAEGLAAAGISRELPYVVDNTQPGAAGLSVYSRAAITPTAPGPPLPKRRNKRSIGGVIDLGGGAGLQVRSVHPPPPVNRRYLQSWKRATQDYPNGRNGPLLTILAGDFNATLDHHPLRDLMAEGGYRDAAEQTGDAWRPTWSNGRWALLTIDHILVPQGMAVLATSSHDLPDSDHDVVVTKLRLPR